MFLWPLLFFIKDNDQVSRKDAEQELNQLNGNIYIKKAIELGGYYQGQELFDDAIYFYKKASCKGSDSKNKSVEAIIGYEIAMKISQQTYNSSLLKLAAQQLKTGADDIIGKDYQYNIYLFADNFLKTEAYGQKSDFYKILDKTKSVYQSITNEREQAALEARTVRTDKEELTSIKSTVNDLNSLKDVLNYKIKVNESLVNSMTRESLIKEMILAQKNRFIDSLAFNSVIDSISLESKNFELAQNESELNLQKANNKLLMSMVGLIFVLSLFLFFRFSMAKAHNKTLEGKNRIIERERQRSEELLLNILPLKVAEELKENGKVLAQYNDNATIMFTDFVNFGNITNSLTPQQLVTDLDYCFGRFDTIVHYYKMEKIKIIGDAYMCIASVPEPIENHAEVSVKVALEFLSFLEEWNMDRVLLNKIPFKIRIGFQSEPVAAGVVGKSKFVFDVWGDAVNVASRMEANSENDRINISEAIHSQVKDKFVFEQRGAIKMKNMKEMNMFFVSKMT